MDYKPATHLETLLIIALKEASAFIHEQKQLGRLKNHNPNQTAQDTFNNYMELADYIHTEGLDEQ